MKLLNAPPVYQGEERRRQARESYTLYVISNADQILKLNKVRLSASEFYDLETYINELKKGSINGINLSRREINK